MFTVDQQQLGLAKESTRGTAAALPTKWYPTKGPAHFDYKLALLKDEGLRGIAAHYPSLAGAKTGDGKIPLIVDPQMMGEFFNSLLGSVSSVQQGATAAYTHTFTRSASIQKPPYTFFQDRGLNVLAYNLGVVKKLMFKGTMDALVDAEAEVLFKSEAAGAIGTPAYPIQQYQAFQNVTFSVAGTPNTDIKDWTLNLDNGSRGHRTLNQSQDVADIITPGRLMIDGAFTIYFQNVTERNKFLANTAVAIEVLAQGAVIASTYKYTMDINIYEAHYKAFPYGEDQGLLAAKVQYEGFYNTSAAKEIQVALTNTDTAY